jgi:hypothetical protein
MSEAHLNRPDSGTFQRMQLFDRREGSFRGEPRELERADVFQTYVGAAA